MAEVRLTVDIAGYVCAPADTNPQRLRGVPNAPSFLVAGALN